MDIKLNLLKKSNYHNIKTDFRNLQEAFYILFNAETGQQMRDSETFL